jgi:hypothetical protein
MPGVDFKIARSLIPMGAAVTAAALHSAAIGLRNKLPSWFSVQIATAHSKPLPATPEREEEHVAKSRVATP